MSIARMSRWLATPMLVIGVLACGLALATAHPLPEESPSPEADLPTDQPPAPPAATEGGSGEAKPVEEPVDDAAALALLHVKVVGNGRPVRLAEVKLLTSGGSDETPPRYTDEQGEVTFTGAPLGRARVRVIAQKWQSTLQKVSLVAGSQELVVELQPLP